MKHGPLRQRCACGAIDVHTHVVPADFPRYAGRGSGARWPAMAPAQACHRSVMIDGKVFRTVPPSSWDGAARAQDMARLGIAHQVLSPMPELLSYWLDAADGAAMCRHLNGVVAALVAADPARFTGLAAVPLQDVGLAIRELEHAVNELGLAGVELGSNIDGVPLGDPRLLPFFEAAEALGAAVFVHALRPAGMERLVGPPALEYALGYPTEVGLAAASMITGGTLARCPRLRIAFSHGAGTLALLLPRLQHAWSVMPGLRGEGAASPVELARRMYVDELVYDERAIRHLAETFGVSQLLLGSDYPFPIQDADPAGRLAALGLPDGDHAAVAYENALRWLDGEAPSTHHTRNTA
mgnify:CR=1 FL=1